MERRFSIGFGFGAPMEAVTRKADSKSALCRRDELQVGRSDLLDECAGFTEDWRGRSFKKYCHD